MKKSIMTLIALVLCITMAALAPAQVMAAANGSGTLYVSDVKVGMGETSEEAIAELLAEGYTVLKDEDGDYSDLNYKAGTNSGMKKGPTQKIVYLGYKTTTDPKDAITDLAVMNMNGGYSTTEYNILMSKHMDGVIKPFVDRFISALEEYRANYKKADNTIGHKRADYYRKMLNKLTDDDTGGKPLGDLLLNKTKYEMGDEAYNKLSDAEKKNHADILTLLMQGNSRAVLLLETLISKSTDAADNTWIDRFLKTTTDDLKAQIKKDNPNLTTDADVIAELDKTYNDTARKVLEKWDVFHQAIVAYDDNVNEIENADLDESENLLKEAEKIDTENMSKEEAEKVAEVIENNTDAMTTVVKAEDVAVVEYLDTLEYADGTLLEFFDRDQSELMGENIRELYPIAAALSDGQIAGLEFLSITDLFSMAIINEDGFDTLKIDDVEPASVYENVDRAIYEPGGVALTNKELRDKQNKKDDDNDFSLSKLGIICWVATGILGLGTIGSVISNVVFVSKANKAYTIYENGINWINRNKELTNAGDAAIKNAQESADAAYASAQRFSSSATISYYFAIGFAVFTALLAAFSIYTTITEMLEYYKVTFAAIPTYMVDETDITEVVNGQTVMKKNETAYYKVALCNRKQGESDVEKDNYRVLGNHNDLNGDVGKQWLALYYVKYKEGKPILADSFKVVKGDSNLPKGYETGIHRFGESAAFNLTHKYYCYNDKPDGTYVYYKNADQTMNQLLGTDTTTTGSMFSAGSLAIGGGIGLLLGGGIVALIMNAKNKKKKEETA